jgi:hypothetical protein
VITGGYVYDHVYMRVCVCVCVCVCMCVCVCVLTGSDLGDFGLTQAA